MILSGWLPNMPWRGLRPNTAGGRNPRRQSFVDNRDPSALDGHEEVDLVEPGLQPADKPEPQSISHQLPHVASPDATLTAIEPSQTEPAPGGTAQQVRLRNAATVPRSNRFSLLRFRHASDPQLSTSYSTSAPGLKPPLPKSTSKCLTFWLFGS